MLHGSLQPRKIHLDNHKLHKKNSVPWSWLFEPFLIMWWSDSDFLYVRKCGV